MGEAGQESVEIGGAGSDEADGGSEAGQDDDEGDVKNFVFGDVKNFVFLD